MTAVRWLVGLSIGSGCEGVDAALVHVGGLGLSATPAVEQYARTPFLPMVREKLRRGLPVSSRELGDAMSSAARHLVEKHRVDLRSVLLVGLHLPATIPLDSLAEFVAEQTGVTVWCRFAARDTAVGGSGWPITPAADYLLAKSRTEDRILIHLGRIASVLMLPAEAKITNLIAFDAAPCSGLLDALVRQGTREKEATDFGGTKAVQGKCLDDLQNELNGEFNPATAFEAARRHGASLNDLLCTYTHRIVRMIGYGCRQSIPATRRPRGVFVSGGGVRNGFLWQLLQQQFPGEPLRRTDEIGIPALGRNAIAAAVLAGLTVDGVSANLPLLTGASGGRLVGRFIPGDMRNWAAVTAWSAEQMWDYIQMTRAA